MRSADILTTIEWTILIFAASNFKARFYSAFKVNENHKLITTCYCANHVSII
jgi:hypothetical protein